MQQLEGINRRDLYLYGVLSWFGMLVDEHHSVDVPPVTENYRTCCDPVWYFTREKQANIATKQPKSTLSCNHSRYRRFCDSFFLTKMSSSPACGVLVHAPLNIRGTIIIAL